MKLPAGELFHHEVIDNNIGGHVIMKQLLILFIIEIFAELNTSKLLMIKVTQKIMEYWFRLVFN